MPTGVPFNSYGPPSLPVRTCCNMVDLSFVSACRVTRQAADFKVSYF